MTILNQNVRLRVEMQKKTSSRMHFPYLFLSSEKKKEEEMYTSGLAHDPFYLFLNGLLLC